eukprot:13056184-Ditylum_brightwellii.AAC.1
MPTLYQERKKASQNIVRLRLEDNRDEGGSDIERYIVVFDTGGGKNSTITAIVWHMFESTNHTQKIRGYGSEEERKLCCIVNAATKAHIPGRDMPIILVLHYAMLNEDEGEIESLVVPFEMINHGIYVDMVPQTLGRDGAIYVDE